MEQDQTVKDRAQDAEQETAEMVVEPGHPGKIFSAKNSVGFPLNGYPTNKKIININS